MICSWEACQSATDDDNSKSIFFVHFHKTTKFTFESSKKMWSWAAVTRKRTWVRFPLRISFFRKISSPFFLTIDCKTYSCDIIVTCNIRCLLGRKICYLFIYHHKTELTEKNIEAIFFCRNSNTKCFVLYSLRRIPRTFDSL